MKNTLKHRQEKIQEKRKKTPRREFLMEVCSRAPLNLYKDEGMITRFPVSDRISYISRDDYLEREDQMKESIPGGDFFSGLTALFRGVAHASLIGSGTGENCDYADSGGYSKNVYLSFIFGPDVENVMYTWNIKFSRHVYNSVAIRSNCEFVYQSTFVTNSYEVFYSRGIEGSKHIWFCSNMIGCEECIGCNDQINKKYMIFDIQYTREAYEEKKVALLSDKEQYSTLYNNASKYSLKTGNLENVENAYVACSVKDARNLLYSGGQSVRTNYYDVLAGGAGNHMYGVYQGVYFSDHLYCSAYVNGSMNIYYSYNLRSCSYCLGCVGLTNKTYCILNKQYTKEERHEEVNEIFSAMNKSGTLGNFLPPTMNPLYFNDTVASLIDDTFTKEEVEAVGYLRRDEKIKVDIPESLDVINAIDLGNYEGHDEQGERTLHPDILKKIIQDSEGNYYRIMPAEYKFLKKYGLPLPRKHWLERMKDNFTIN